MGGKDDWSKCPLCGEFVSRPESFHAGHRLRIHLWGHLPRSGNSGYRACWCGEQFDWSVEMWHHWQAHGGVLVHFLACQLGEYRGK